VEEAVELVAAEVSRIVAEALLLAVGKTEDVRLALGSFERQHRQHQSGLNQLMEVG